ncbi:MAG: site-specific integrase [Methylococcaceae bacterium]|nr:MAG: site-specific integrase [Methylococcaceae bacterium]
MSLFKRKDSMFYWIKFTVHGRRIQESTGTDDRKAAQEYHDRRKAELWEQSRLGVKAAYTWQQAVVRYVQETSHKATHHEDVARFRWLDKHLGTVALIEVTRDMLDVLTKARLADGVSNGTVNRTLALVRAVLRKAAHEWEWLDRTPKVRLLPEPKRRIRFLTLDEAEKLLAELPEHLAAMARFSLETGLRQANVSGLTWAQVDMEAKRAWIHPDQAKAKKAIAVPLSDVAMQVLRGQVGKHSVYVFTYRGEPVTQISTKAWWKALKRAGIEDFRWHDLRHTWASWHAQRGTPLHVLQELGGWESVEMVRRYAHLSGDHLAEYATSMTGGPRLVATNRLRSVSESSANDGVLTASA